MSWLSSLVTHMVRDARSLFFFFFNDTATTEIYTLSLHDALPIFGDGRGPRWGHGARCGRPRRHRAAARLRRRAPVRRARPDRKSTPLNSSHLVNSYAVFCLKKKKLTTNFWF